MRASKSLRTGRPKISSFSSTEPTSWLSRFLTASFMLLALLLGGRSRLGSVSLDRGRERQPFGRPALDRVLQRNVAALMAGDSALDQDQATLGVGRHDLEI